MDELWKALRSIHVATNPEASRRRTDQNHAMDLQLSQTADRWRRFYRVVDALEQGCGYQPFPKLDTLCKKAIACDEGQFLRILAEEPSMLDIVAVLLYVDRETMLHWIEAEMIFNVNVLFECLRRIFQGGPLPEQAEKTAARGLLRLYGFSPERFQYFLQTSVLFREDCVGVIRAMLPRLTKEGWSRLSACITYTRMDNKHLLFWNDCTAGQNWQTIGFRAEPLFWAWRQALEKSAAERAAWNSLYNEASNMLIGILLNQINTPRICEQVMEKITTETGTAMYRWYESSLRQKGVLLAALSRLEHLRLVWLKIGKDSLSPPPLSACGSWS